MEILPGIYTIDLPLPNSPLDHVNVYLVKGHDGWTIVDTGLDSQETLDLLNKKMKLIGLDVTSISQVIVTHAHPDHYGLANKFKELSGAEVLMHRTEKEFIDTGYAVSNQSVVDMFEWYGRNGLPQDCLPNFQDFLDTRFNVKDMVVADRGLVDWETLTVGEFEFMAIGTPGHSAGHLCLYEPKNNILFSGDHVLPEITPNVSLYLERNGNPLGDFIESLHRVGNLKIKLVLPAHDSPFTNLSERIDEITFHHKMRNKEILQSLRLGPKTAYDVASSISWMEGKAQWNMMIGPYDKPAALGETLAHLAFMKENGIVKREDNEGLIYWSAA